MTACAVHVLQLHSLGICARLRGNVVGATAFRHNGQPPYRRAVPHYSGRPGLRGTRSDHAWTNGHAPNPCSKTVAKRGGVRSGPTTLL